MRDILILYSGGLDSLIMYKLAKAEHPDANVRCVWFNIGQEYCSKEEAALPSFVEKRSVEWLHKKSDLIGKSDSLSGNIIIPGRNMVLVTLAASIYLPDEIWLGALLGETHAGSTDKNETFREKINDVLNYVHSPYKKGVEVKFPLVDKGFGKFESVEWAYTGGFATEQEILQSSSCLSGEDGNCGSCVVCLRRWGIFHRLGIEEDYNTFPLYSTANRKIVECMLEYEAGKSTSCHYDKYRRREIVPAVLQYFNSPNPKIALEALNEIQ